MLITNIENNYAHVNIGDVIFRKNCKFPDVRELT
jgi:hypothetical protein